MKNFALIGASGYIAERHLRAIKETGNDLIAALDPFDSVGIIDSYFPYANFFVEPESFDRHIEKNKLKKNSIGLCFNLFPNYLHDAHIRMALRWDSHAICEKPLVLNPWNLDALEKMQSSFNKKIWNILQLREHDTIIELKKELINLKIKFMI